MIFTTMLSTIKTQDFFSSGTAACEPYQDGRYPDKLSYLSTILSASGIGTWALFPQSTQLQLCPTFKSLLKLEENTEYTFIELFRLIDCSCRPAVIADLKAACQDTGTFTVEFKIGECLEGGYQWFKLTGNIYRNYPNEKPAFMGTLTEITAQKNREIWITDRLALLSHELRGPLSVIKLYIQRAAKISAEKKNQDAMLCLNRADDQVTVMAGMMDDFLNEEALKNAGVCLLLEWFDMRSLVDEIVTHLKIRFPSHRFLIKVPSSVTINADKRKIAQVITNYLTNAVKYSSNNSLIEISCRRVNAEITLAVTDQGQGISPEHINKIFDRYYRVPNANAKADGYGLGLYLVKKIIEAHGGKVGADSALNIGSSFYFKLPVATNTLKN